MMAVGFSYPWWMIETAADILFIVSFCRIAGLSINMSGRVQVTNQDRFEGTEAEDLCKKHLNRGIQDVQALSDLTMILPRCSLRIWLLELHHPLM